MPVRRTTVFFFLPVNSARRLLTQWRNLSDQPCDSTHHTAPMATRQRILILDDEQDLLEIYQEILARLPSQPEIRTASNGHDAIAMLENEPFALLLVDLNMPQMDGFQVLAIVRRRFPALRTVVITSATEADLRARAYRVGVDLYMEKPKTG